MIKRFTPRAVALMLMSGLSLSAANSQETATKLHPEIGLILPNKLKNSDILALSENDQLAWIHGAVTMTATMAAITNPETAKCVMNWYFENSAGPQTLAYVMTEYPDEKAASTIYAAARMTCKAL